ncbi:MAG: PD-(D/E)XK nuclease family protein [Actinomycetia bacterium]|nr:PD-(D/E)XK nuclease family protein [Actinomycetes bacterium]MCP4961010.1 PD-(D/E)XK nuclease family protein [Actinomycetes bacterium]
MISAEPHPRPDGPPSYLSPSSASTFEQCQRRWKFRYVDRLPDPPGEKALIGTFVHRVLEELFARAEPDRSIETARHIARQVWPEIENDQAYKALNVEAEHGRRVRWDGWRLVEAYFAMERPDEIDVVEREQRIETQLGDVPFVGVVDRVERRDGSLVVTDYKTGRAPNSRYEADRLHQVQLYAAALDSMGARPDTARLLYLGARSIEADVTSETIDAAVGSISATWSAVNAALDVGEFDPCTGPLCAWCPYDDRCPEGTVEIERRYGPR